MKSFIKTITYITIISLYTQNLNAQTEPEMVFVKGGTFKMGNPNGDIDEKPQHNVKLNDFYISKYEITVKQYREYCNATGKKFPVKPNETWYIEHERAARWTWSDSNPMCKINWYQANEYCQWLAKKTGKKYSLPTEAQWEYAARGGNKSQNFTYSGSNNINDVAWHDETTYERGPMPVGKLKPNELGIYDMSGNVWEWCLDFYGAYSKKQKTDPQGPKQGQFKVIRGGSWYYAEQMTKLTTRDGPYPDFSNYNYGFRVVINTK